MIRTKNRSNIFRIKYTYCDKDDHMNFQDLKYCWSNFCPNFFISKHFFIEIVLVRTLKLTKFYAGFSIDQLQPRLSRLQRVLVVVVGKGVGVLVVVCVT